MPDNSKEATPEKSGDGFFFHLAYTILILQSFFYFTIYFLPFLI